MPSRIDAVLERRLGHRPKVAKLFRYSAASVAGVVTSQVVLIGLVLGAGVDAAPANVVAVVAGALPNYLINRAWTFNKTGAHSLSREILPFWGMAILGLLLSTVAVGWADEAFDGNFLALSAANIGSFGVLWIARFFILDRLVFAPLAELVEEHVDDEGHLHLHEVHHDHADADADADAGDGDGAPVDETTG